MRPKTAVLLHLFYHDLWPEMSAHVRTVPDDCRLYVNLVEGNPHNPSMKGTILRAFPDARVEVTENRGRDVGGYMRMLGAVLAEETRYDHFVLIHTKKSDRQDPEWGRRWRMTLLHGILGSREVARGIVDAFASHAEIGMVGARELRYSFETHGPVAYCTNQELMFEQCKRYGLATDRSDFIAGTMFWVRAGIFYAFFRKHDPLAIAAEMMPGDHSDDAGASLAHAWERLFGYVVTSAGYRVDGR